MNHCFLIQAHKYPDLLYKLIKVLDASNHYFFIHIDKRSCEMLESRYVSELTQKNNCFIYSEYAVNWGSEKQFWASLFLLEKALGYAEVDFTYYHLISGQDFPLRNNKEFDRFFSDKGGLSFLGMIDTTGIEKRYMVYHFDSIVNPRGNIYCRIFYKFCKLFVQFQLFLSKWISIRPSLKYKLYKGSSWWSFHHELADYVNKFVKDNPKFLKRFNYTTCCDEVFYHVIVMNSPYSDYIVNDSLRYIDWSDSSRGYPCILDERDYEQIGKTNNLFCRKIEPHKSKELIKKIETIMCE